MRWSQGSLRSTRCSSQCLHVVRLADVMHTCFWAHARCLLIILVRSSVLRDVIMEFCSESRLRYGLAFPLAWQKLTM